jgi:hypothetical protein
VYFVDSFCSYAGSLVRGQRHGSGRLCFSESGSDGSSSSDGSSEACYDGQWAHGVRSGRGRFESSAFAYVGLWLNDAPHDPTHGRMWFPLQGAAYAGGVVEGLPDGHGVMLHSSSSSSSSSGESGGGGVGGGVGSSGLGSSGLGTGRYEGLFHKGLKHGHGAFVSGAAGSLGGHGSGSGWAYVGDWRWDHRHGLGQMATGRAALALTPPGWLAEDEEAVAAEPLRDNSREDAKGGPSDGHRIIKRSRRSSNNSSSGNNSSRSGSGSSSAGGGTSGSDRSRGTLYQVTLPCALE